MTDPTRKLSKEDVVRAWETMLSIARSEMEETTNPDLRVARAREVEALEARLTEIRKPEEAEAGCNPCHVRTSDAEIPDQNSRSDAPPAGPGADVGPDE